MRMMPIAFLLVTYGALVGCSSPPPKPPQPVNVKLTLVASPDVNPDGQNRPSPIVVRIYQLKDDTGFKDADYFALYDKEAATLARRDALVVMNRDPSRLHPHDIFHVVCHIAICRCR